MAKRYKMRKKKEEGMERKTDWWHSNDVGDDFLHNIKNSCDIDALTSCVVGTADTYSSLSVTCCCMIVALTWNTLTESISSKAWCDICVSCKRRRVALAAIPLSETVWTRAQLYRSHRSPCGGRRRTCCLQNNICNACL